MNRSPEKLDYLPGLDGIRALAAFLVIFAHWPDDRVSLKFGWIGVNIFFVLSGFLITRILLHEKEKVFKIYVKAFFLKRILRIFPIYYLFLFLTALIIFLISFFSPQLSKDDAILSGIAAIKHDAISYITYTYNIKINLAYFFKWKNYPNPFFGHLWSLAVEEQFYLIFPLFVYYLNNKLLKKLIISIIVICPLMRLWAAIMGVHLVSDEFWLGEFMYKNTIFQADALATGAALALFNVKIRFPYGNFFLVSITCLMVGFTCLIFLRKAGFFLVEAKSLGFNYPGFWFDEKTKWRLLNIRAFYQYSLVNLFAFTLIAPATIKKPLFPAVFQSAPVAYLGKISYGIYLFHVPLIAFFILAASFFGGWFKVIAGPFIGIGLLILYLATVIFLAHISYKYFEQKVINKYKYKLQ